MSEPNKKGRAQVTADRVRELLHYDPATGWLTWRVVRAGTAKAGTRAGSKFDNGYRYVCVDGRVYSEHRIIWLMVTGEFPAEQLDHRNGTGDDNRIDNLRQATQAENQQNRKVMHHSRSGLIGVSWHGRTGKWYSHIRIDGKKKHLGVFVTAEDAHAAYLDAKREIHKFQPQPRAA